jgi:DNA-binding SARP family transcriptional activator
LNRLIDTSLVTIDRTGEEECYGLSETIRAFALERLRQESPGLEARLRRAHAAFFREMAERLSPRLFGPQRASALDRLAAERDNLRAALGASLDPVRPVGDEWREEGLRLAAALWWAWFHRGEWTEGRWWLDRALDHPADDTVPDVLPTEARANALCGAGWLAFAQGDIVTARRRLSASAAAFRRRRDGRGLALAAGFLSQTLLAQDDLVESRRLAGEAVALARNAGDDWGLALARISLGNVERARGNDLAAGRLYEEGIAAARVSGDRWLETMGLRDLGVVARRAGKTDRAVALLRESLTLSHRAGERWFVTGGLEELATIAAAEGDPIRATRLLGAAKTLRDSIGAPVMPFHRDRYESVVAALRRALPANALAGHWAAGAALSLDEAVSFALELPAVAPPASAPADPTIAAGPANVTPFSPVVIRARPREPMARPPTIPSLRITALGAGRVELGDRSLAAADWTYAKPRELLFYLTDHADRTKEQVGLALWPEASAEQLRGSFHVALHHLRRVLGDAGWVRYADRRYAVDRERPIVYDVARFEECLAAARRAAEAPEQATVALEEAVALYGGDYLDDHAGNWIETRRDRLRRAFLDCLLQLGEARLTTDRPAAAEAAFRRLLSEDDLDEAGNRGLIKALARQGQRGQAIRHYDGFVALLQTGLTASPAAETTDLVTRLRRGEAI